MKEKSLFEQMGGTYTEINGILYPNLVLVTTNYEIGFWGQRHKEYLKEHHRIIYYNLLTSGKLNSYLYNIDNEAKKKYNVLVNQIAKAKEITEQLKIDDMMKWVSAMNNIANQAREIVYDEIIYKYK